MSNEAQASPLCAMMQTTKGQISFKNKDLYLHLRTKHHNAQHTGQYSANDRRPEKVLLRDQGVNLMSCTGKQVQHQNSARHSAEWMQTSNKPMRNCLSHKKPSGLDDHRPTTYGTRLDDGS
jgi:hypothetical protein